MIHVILPFLTAIALSGIAAYYSVIGLAQIFPGSYWPIIIMGSVLEAAKLVTVSWVYNHWKSTFSALKLYFLIAVVLLMGITSMGIFGYLSKAHIEHSSTVAPQVAKVEIYEEKIKVIQSQIERNNKNLSQYDEAVRRLRGTTRILVSMMRLSIKLWAGRKMRKVPRGQIRSGKPNRKTVRESLLRLRGYRKKYNYLQKRNSLYRWKFARLSQIWGL